MNTFFKIGILAVVVAGLSGSDVRTTTDAVVAHEWGTFTSVAGQNGQPIVWAPLSGPADLPCFVERSDESLSGKAFPGLVRMETPVLYFYSQRPTSVSVHVDFPQGWITEWYPRASSVGPERNARNDNWFKKGSIEWKSVEISPGENPQLPTTQGPSHYYAARNTDGAALRVSDQREKLLFYRGIANFGVPMRAKFTEDGKLAIANTGSEATPLLIWFENRQGRVGYRVARNVKDGITLAQPDLSAPGDVRQELVSRLVEAGLYPKEAAAMVETWSDSWFEEGSRVFYIYARSRVDALLPLRITPAPKEIVRVFVGRVELLAPWIEETINSVVAGGSSDTLVKFGRFIDPFVQQMQEKQHSKLFGNANLERARWEISRNVNYGACVK